MALYYRKKKMKEIILIQEKTRKVFREAAAIATNAARWGVSGPLYTILMPEGVSCEAIASLACTIGYSSQDTAPVLGDKLMIIDCGTATETISAQVDKGCSVFVIGGMDGDREVYCVYNGARENKRYYADKNGTLIDACERGYRLTVMPAYQKPAIARVYEKVKECLLPA